MLKILEFVWNALGKALAFIVSLPGMIVTAVGSFVAFVSSLFSDAFDFSGVSSVISDVSQMVNSLGDVDASSGGAQFVLFCSGLDTLLNDAVLAVSITFGLTAIVLFGAVLAVVAVMVPVFAVRGTLKLVSICSAGFVRPLLVLALLPFAAFADLEVQHLGPNVVVVSGTGTGDNPAVVITNVIGYCTNCIAATPEQMRTIKNSLQEEISQINAAADFIEREVAAKQEHIEARNSDVAGYYKTSATLASTISATSLIWVNLTNYVFSADNTQARLDRERYAASTTVGTYGRPGLAHYNDGIYDYAHSQDAEYEDLANSLQTIRGAASDQLRLAGEAANSVVALPEDLCTEITYLPGTAPGEGGTGGTTNVPGIGIEQLNALLDYVKHIDGDFHDLLEDVKGGTNDLARLRAAFDAYAKLLSSALYQDGGTIVTDGANTWSNVYVTGSSPLYDYNRSNVLQRIELLLYGLTGLGNETTEDDPSADYSDFEKLSGDLDSGLGEMSAGLSESLDGQRSNLNSIGQAFVSFFNGASFLGGGSVQNQFLDSVSIDFEGNSLDVSALSVSEGGKSALQGAATVVRICMQLLYHLGFLALVFVYYRYFFTAAARFLKWGGELISGIFGS